MPKKDSKKNDHDEIIRETAPEAADNANPGADELPPAMTTEEAVEKLLQELNNTAAERDKYLNFAQRTVADFDNYRRRNETIGAARYLDGLTAAIEQILPVMDNFERALSLTEENEQNRAILEGVKMVFKQLSGALLKLGCSPMETPKGTAFDPNLHNAMMTVPCGEGDESGSIADTFQTGYMLNGKVIRHANVRVFS